MRFPRRALLVRARYLLAGLVAIPVLAAGGSAAAASVDHALAPCAQDLTQPFLPWLDPLSYAFAPNGGLESGLVGWSSSGGARVVGGNESYAVHGAADAYSLSLPPGASATTPPICIGMLTPTTRFFVRNTGAQLSTLRVEVLYTTVLGIRTSALVGLLVGSPSWQPTLPLPLLANVLGVPPLTGGSTQVSLRFTPLGSGGSWQLDDVYVDPYKGT
jgi:hypothetical protein